MPLVADLKRQPCPLFSQKVPTRFALMETQHSRGETVVLLTVLNRCKVNSTG